MTVPVMLASAIRRIDRGGCVVAAFVTCVLPVEKR
ncbi:hypothetical protein Ae406Ps2_5654 [Pseudonocardia sp. Ae406_Ps2]|nr:hypothetical protein Ae406Ps2_5654 [Pseudonocardia sp. Ae406_Ps2]